MSTREKADAESASDKDVDPSASYVFALAVAVLALLSGVGLSASYPGDQQASHTVEMAAK
jgi:hypothetical protein